MSTLVNFPWYDIPPLHIAHDQLWYLLRGGLIQRGLVNLPEKRHRNLNNDILLLSNQLLLTQTCGFDVANRDSHQLKIIGAPVFALPDCPRGHYFSYIVSRKSFITGKFRLAINDSRSWSGCHALLRYGKSENLEIDWAMSSITGSHARSLEKLSRGESDLAAIDAVSMSLHLKYNPKLFENLKIIDRTPAIPAPPYVTSAENSEEIIEILFEELRAVIQSAFWVRQMLFLLDHERMSFADYRNCQQRCFQNLGFAEAGKLVSVLAN